MIFLPGQFETLLIGGLFIAAVALVFWLSFMAIPDWFTRRSERRGLEREARERVARMADPAYDWEAHREHEEAMNEIRMRSFLREHKKHR